MADLITMTSSGLNVPDEPILPFIEGDGTGPDIWAAAVRVFGAAVEKAYDGKRKIHWTEVMAGEKSFNQSGSWLPDETLDAFRKYLVGKRQYRNRGLTRRFAIDAWRRQLTADRPATQSY